MSKLGVQLLLAVNRILPAPALPDPRDTAQVTRWQYQTSDLLMKLWGLAGGATPRTVLREIHRGLRPDGRLILVFNPWGSPRGSHLGNVLRMPWCQLLFDRATLGEATLAETRRMARGMQSSEEQKSIEEFGRGLVEFFQNHVHPTRIREFREWIRDEGQFKSELELHQGPRPLGEKGWLRLRPFEEWLTASYGTILRPLRP